jgi:hypothetical protein
MSDRPDLARQQGSAMFYSFIVTLLLFLASAYFAFAIFQDNQKLLERETAWLQEKQTVEAQMLLRDQYIESISEVIGETGEFKGKEGFNWGEYGGQPEPLQNVTLAGRYESAMDRKLGDLGLPQDSRQVGSALNYVTNYVQSIQKQLSDAKDNSASLETRIAELQNQISSAANDTRRQVSDLNQQIQEQADSFQNRIDEAEQNVANVNSTNKNLRDQLREAQDARQTEAVAARKRENTLMGQIAAINAKLKLVNAPDEADGTILSANQAVARAWVDIGRNNMLKLGTKFRILDANSGKQKATGIVTTLEGNRSELRIADLADRYDPVREGDKIANSLYSPELRHTIYLMGRFGTEYSQPVVRAYLERIGNKVVDRLDVGVTLIIVGNDTINEDGDGYVPIIETEEYKRGTELGIEFVRLNQIRDLLNSADVQASPATAVLRSR